MAQWQMANGASRELGTRRKFPRKVGTATNPQPHGAHRDLAEWEVTGPADQPPPVKSLHFSDTKNRNIPGLKASQDVRP